MDFTISVVMATYNGEKYIRQQIDSLINQTSLPNEIIIVDDCSSDSTIAILESYKEKYPFITIHVNEKNLGINRNFENGCKLAKFDYIMFCDQDDTWDADKIASFKETISAHPEHGLYYSDARIIDSDSNITQESELDYHHCKPLSGNPTLSLHYGNVISGHNMVVKRSLLVKTYPFLTETLYDHWLAIFFSETSSIFFLNKALVSHRIHDNNAHNNHILNKKRKKKRILFKKFRKMQIKRTRYIERIKRILEITQNKVLINHLNQQLNFYKNYNLIYYSNSYKEVLVKDVDLIKNFSDIRKRRFINKTRKGGLYHLTRLF